MNKILKYILGTIIVIAAAMIIAGYNPLAERTTETVDNGGIDRNSAMPTQVPGQVIYQGEEGKTALELLKAKHKVETQEYTGVGEFVTTINGIAPPPNQFWAFYVNGQSSNVGASQYQTKNSDIIEWRLEEIKTQ